MRLAPCASAPSHPLHVMPPRITRNSDRPRASNRTMVAHLSTRLACHVSRLDWRARHRTMKATEMEDNAEAKPLAQIERHSYSEVGWISRQNLLASGRGRTFS